MSLRANDKPTMAPISAFNCTACNTPAAGIIGRHVPEAEFMVVVGTLFPLLAYPFLPQHEVNPGEDLTNWGGVDGWERSIQICPATQLFFIHAPNFFLLFLHFIYYFECTEWKAREKSLDYTNIPLWVVYLNLICLSGIDPGKMNTAPRRHQTMADFKRPAACTMTFLLFEVLRRLSVTFARATGSWTLGIVIALVVEWFGLCTVGHAVVEPAEHAIRACLYRFMTRNVKAWTWLPQNGTTEDACCIFRTPGLLGFLEGCFSGFAVKDGQQRDLKLTMLVYR
ncbi:hypothetical protein QBC34DRAFT_468981 [Podospora aff. communis PSN243]|uniref:Uncharacterized protein n=1 Tax=Podospora aff. communis PSN243 TaxID=3040156 RepID=A0AAV9GFD5_9PEZI|nr:hypothetical protein QBC34DRAFT_468981 [Podospora aff. communis PSN243]